ncbi:hypothetical protein R1flu_027250 [Riccia fluitans]|uniref:F-box domain-containing protein n=1 Tax=Riccia fluitans TaxID=41844 RepID=A0ABD1XI86_9MARC
MEGTYMDSMLWRNLPPDVLEKILSKLPISSLMSFSRVCKRWENLIQSPGFAHRCDSAKPIVFCHYPGNSKKVKSFLAFPSAKTNAWEKHTLEFASEPVTLVAADKGLMCFRPEGKHSTLFIYNPLTRQVRKLRVPGKSREDTDPEMLVGLTVNQDTGNYKLVVGFIEFNIEEEEESRGTHIYDSVSSLWTLASVYPIFPQDEEDEWDDSTRWDPHVSVRCGENFYWVVEETYDTLGTRFFKFLVKYDTKAGTWTIDEPVFHSYERYIKEEDFPSCLPDNLPYVRLVKPFNRRSVWESELPQWNFHLAAHNETVYVTLFDSLISKEPYSGDFSSLIPEVKVIDSELVRKLLDHADFKESYLPTKAVASNDTWYIVFEDEGVCCKDRGRRPLRIFAFNPNRHVSRWLPELHSHSSCSSVLSSLPPYSLPGLQTFVATFRAFV